MRNELGGSYYVTREIVQELEHKYKLARAGQSNLASHVDLKESSSGTSSESIGEKVAPTVAVAKKVATKRDQRSTIFKAEVVKKEELSGKASDVLLDEQSLVVASTKVEVPMETSIHTNNMVRVRITSLT